jgi:uncharacterized protein
MLTRTLGNTGLTIPAVGFGGMRFADIGDFGACVDSCRHAYDLGIRYFDTAPGYFGGKSEEVFGEAFAGVKDVLISTKSSKRDRSEFRKNFEESLVRLKRDKVAIFHIWYILTFEDYREREKNGILEEALKMKSEGLFDHLFISSHMNSEGLVTALGSGIFEGVTIGYSPVNFLYRKEAVKFARSKNIAVVTMNPLAGGLIPKNPEVFSVLKRPQDNSVVEGTLRFILSDPGVSLALVGVEKPEHADEAIAAISPFMPWSDAQRNALENSFNDAYQGLCTGCGYCKECPEGLAPSQFMLAYNRKFLGAGDKAISDSLQWEWKIPPEKWDACSECGLCEEQCTQHLPIMDRMKEIAKLERPAKP